MNFPLQLLLCALFTFTEASTQNINTNGTYSPPLDGADFVQCRNEILAGKSPASNLTFKPVFVNAGGTRVDGPANAHGVDYMTCVTYCHTRPAPPQWSFFAPQFTAWLLPFIALTAQLPYQAVTTWDNLMSAVLAVGSPALAAYSLILTFLSTRWLERQCAAAIDQIPPTDLNTRRILGGLFQNMKGVLCLAQQEPYENCDFQPLQDIQQEVTWWETLHAIVDRSKRGYTASFVHQLLWVNIAFAFSIIDAFGSEKIGNRATAFGLAISLVWQWETPVVMGWVLVGTSTVDRAVRSAITTDAQGFFRQQNYPSPYNVPIQRATPIGDRARPGPIYNYARVFIWTRRAESLISRYQPPPIDPGQPPESQWRISSFKHVIYALLLALALQWSTSGASIMLSYLTPVVGLSCRSGGFLIYTVSSTVVLFSLILSFFLSDLYLSARERGTKVSLLTNLYGQAAVALRVVGKAIAVLNAVWIFIHCVFEFTYFYENCWCNARYAILGENGYWVWLSVRELRELWNLREIWGGSTALAIVVPGLYIVSFLVTHHHHRR